MPTAILIDAAFFLNRLPRVYKEFSHPFHGNEPKKVSKMLHSMALGHLNPPKNKKSSETEKSSLYRIMVYDCPPLEKRIHTPVAKQNLDFSKTPAATFRKEFHRELTGMRKTALRLGRLSDKSRWVLNPDKVDGILSGSISPKEVEDKDFPYDTSQKGVDMKIGLDIASLSLKRLVDRIILVSGDSDFVPAAKLARREGIDFVLDPMWSPINRDLHEHVDGMHSVCPRPQKKLNAPAYAQ